jgi:hypothetical protein
MFNTIFGAGDVPCYGSGSDQMMLLLAAPAPQHYFEAKKSKKNSEKSILKQKSRSEIAEQVF